MTRPWLLNLTADLDLESPNQEPSAAARRAASRFAPRAAELLVPEGDSWWDGESAPPSTSGSLEARAFCPTPRALACFVAAGLTPPPAPSLQILRATNDRAFCAELGQTLPGAHFIRDRAQLRLAEGDWLLKRAFGFVGRGQRVVRAPLEEADEHWLTSALKLGGVQVEPRVHILREVGTPGFIDRASVHVGQPVEQLCEAGVWRESRPLGAASLDDVVPRLRDTTRAVGEALVRIGYFGPFGVDAYLYRRSTEDAEDPRWNLRSEINARYSMGWALGWDTRPDV